MLARGSTLGPYELDARLGSGGMGEVYRARDTRLGRIVAIKVLSPRVSHDENVRKRFLREARAISSLNHPHICALYDIGRDNGSDFLVMEYLEGETLAQRLARERLHYDEALRYAIEIASALERAHRQGVVHRDLKPANIMVTRTGAKLLDFGLARLAASGEESSIGPLTGDDSMIGTIEYMSPEQLKGEAADARSDIFSFGILMHEMVTGARPFEGANRASVMGSILFAPYVSGHSQEVMFPDSVDRLIGACLEKNPDDRIQTARDLRRELEWIRDGTSAHVSRRKRKVPKAVILSMLLGAAVLAGAA